MNQKVFFSIILILIIQAVSLSNNSKTDSLKMELEAAQNPEDEINILIELSIEIINTDPVESETLSLEALKKSKEIRNNRLIWKSLNTIAYSYKKQHNTEKSTEYAIQTLEQAKKIGDEMLIAKSYSLVGGRMLNLHNYAAASDYLFKSLKVFEKEEAYLDMSTAYILIGIIYYELQENEKALEFGKKGLKYALKVNHSENISAALNNIATVYQKQNELKKARENFERAYELNKKDNNTYWQGHNMYNIGVVLYKQKDYENSLKYFIKANEIYKSLNRAVSYSGTQVQLANVYFETGEIDKAKELNYQALKTGKKYKDLFVIQQAAQSLTKIYEKTSSDSTNKYRILYYETKDSLNKEKYSAQVEKYELQYQFEREMKQMELKHQRQAFINFLIIAGLVVLVIFSILLWGRLRVRMKNNRLKREQLEKDLEYKNKEFVLKAMGLMKKNELVTDILKQLKEVKDNAVKDATKKTISRISTELSRSFNQESVDEFEIRFKEVHKEFYEKLITRYPDLWPSELKLCAFLRLNMTTKEISQLTGQSVSSLEKARYRLRKKLNISNSETNLISFLSQI